MPADKTPQKLIPDEQTLAKAERKLRAMLGQSSVMERWSILATELNWVLNGRPAAESHRKPLPEYCYNIFELQRRTIYKSFTPQTEVVVVKDEKLAATSKTIAEAKQCLTIDFAKLGEVFAMGERCQAFFDNEADEKIKQAGLADLTPEKEADFDQFMFGEQWPAKLESQLQALAPSKPVEQILAEQLGKAERTIKQAVPDWHQKAVEWGPEATTQFHEGVAKGSAGFLDANGNLKGEGKLKLPNTYEFLLLAWPEIGEMLKAQPPKTRNDLWFWLEPFSHAGWIEIEDLEQLNRLCSEIKLKLKKPGAPRKAK